LENRLDLQRSDKFRNATPQQTRQVTGTFVERLFETAASQGLFIDFLHLQLASGPIEDFLM